MKNKIRPLRVLYKNNKYFVIINGVKYIIDINNKKALIYLIKQYKKIKYKRRPRIYSWRHLKNFMWTAIKQHAYNVAK